MGMSWNASWMYAEASTETPIVHHFPYPPLKTWKGKAALAVVQALEMTVGLGLLSGAAVTAFVGRFYLGIILGLAAFAVFLRFWRRSRRPSGL